MNKKVRKYFFSFSKFSLGTYLIFGLTGIIIGWEAFFAVSIAYLLSCLFVGSNLGVVKKIKMEDHKKFYRIFFISLALRFLLVIACIIFMLKVIKIHQIYFTVSFIISYIFHSVIEIKYVNKILETDSIR